MANGTRKGRPLNSKGKQPVGKTANSRTAINQRIEEEDRRAMERRQQAKSRRASRFLERNDEEDDTDAEEQDAVPDKRDDSDNEENYNNSGEQGDYQADDQNGESDPGNPSSSEEEENIHDSGSTDELCKPPMTPSSIRGKHLFPSPMKSQRNRTPIITKPNKNYNDSVSQNSKASSQLPSSPPLPEQLQRIELYKPKPSEQRSQSTWKPFPLHNYRRNRVLNSSQDPERVCNLISEATYERVATLGFTGSTYVAKAGGVAVKFGPWLFNDVDREENLPIVMKELAVSIGRKYAHSQADARLKKTTAEHLARGLMSKLSLQKLRSHNNIYRSRWSVIIGGIARGEAYQWLDNSRTPEERKSYSMRLLEEYAYLRQDPRDPTSRLFFHQILVLVIANCCYGSSRATSGAHAVHTEDLYNSKTIGGELFAFIGAMLKAHIKAMGECHDSRTYVDATMVSPDYDQLLSAWNDQSRDVQVLLTRIILDKAKRYNAKNKETEPALQTPITNAYANRVDDLQQEAAFSSSSLEPSPRQFMGQPDSSDELYSSEIESGRGNLPGTLKRPSPLGSKSQQPSNSPPKRRKHSNSKAAAVEASEDQEAVLNRNSGDSRNPPSQAVYPIQFRRNGDNFVLFSFGIQRDLEYDELQEIIRAKLGSLGEEVGPADNYSLRAEWTGCKEARPCNFGDEWEKIREDAFNEGWGDKILFLREQVPEDFAEEP